MDAANSGQLYILSGPRSGSTLLRYILDTHSQIASPGEVGMGALCTQLELLIRCTKGEASRGLSAEQRKAMAIAETRSHIDGIMGSYLQLKGKQIWCEKSILNLQYLPVLRQVFPQARFICLHRDSLDFVHSCLECSRLGFMLELSDYAARQPRNLTSAMMTAWIENTSRLLEFEKENPERCFRLRYEDLVTEPERALRPLFEFVGVPWEEGLLEAIFTTPHDQGSGAVGDVKILWSTRIDPSSVGTGERIDLDAIPAASQRTANALSQELSYPPLGAGPRLPWQVAAEQQISDAFPGFRKFIETYLAERLDKGAAQAREINGSCKFVIKGSSGGSWKLDFTASPPAISSDWEIADCSLVMAVQDFLDMIAGRLNPILAWWYGKVQVEGDLMLAQKVGKLIYQ